jgi:hypothetical protein
MAQLQITTWSWVPQGAQVHGWLTDRPTNHQLPCYLDLDKLGDISYQGNVIKYGKESVYCEKPFLNVKVWSMSKETIHISKLEDHLQEIA